tara:strand:+ start:698 stop:946 length:249 start_codon:yes stop_codon:yes gene_type:complete
MSKDILTKEQKEELQKLADELKNIADDVVGEYLEVPSQISGSVVQIHENSPFMNEMYSETGWKHVIHGSVEEAIEAIKNKKA